MHVSCALWRFSGPRGRAEARHRPLSSARGTAAPVSSPAPGVGQEPPAPTAPAGAAVPWRDEFLQSRGWERLWLALAAAGGGAGAGGGQEAAPSPLGCAEGRAEERCPRGRRAAESR